MKFILKKSIIFLVLIVTLLMASSVFAATTVDNYSVNLISMDMIRVDTQNKEHIMRVTGNTANDADITKFADGTIVQNWFSLTGNLNEGHYTKVIITIGPKVRFKGTVDNLVSPGDVTGPDYIVLNPHIGGDVTFTDTNVVQNTQPNFTEYTFTNADIAAYGNPALTMVGGNIVMTIPIDLTLVKDTQKNMTIKWTINGNTVSDGVWNALVADNGNNVKVKIPYVDIIINN